MHDKQLRKVQITNMAIWVFAIILPIVAPTFASKSPKIFEFLIPLFQLMLAAASTRMFGDLLSASKMSQNDSDSK